MKKTRIPKPKKGACNVSKADRKRIKADLEEKLLIMLPALQSNIWKELGIKRRYCSELMKVLEDNGLIKRRKVKGGTYMVEKCDINNSKFVNQTKFYALLSDSGRFSPCTGCVMDCDPGTCDLMNKWLLDIKAK
ncbi:MAG: hypothetical protein PHP08_00515 [Candidatus Dojkabacteria bacterium]|nr:hypothetical protein [Candidatus Dojkabacteria bacterium]